MLRRDGGARRLVARDRGEAVSADGGKRGVTLGLVLMLRCLEWRV
jgi:hypothetical protein